MKVGVFVELYRKNQQLLQHEKKLLATNKSLQKEIEERRASEEKVRLLNEKLVENNAHLKAVNEELDRFAYVASHDLQEPLRKIMVFSDKILMKDNHDPDTEKYFKKIVGSSKRMQALIDDLLNFSRHAMKPTDFKETDLNLLVKEAVAELEIEIEKTNAKIRLTDLPVISAVPGLMQQMFYNLLSNAIKFRKKTEAPEIHIHSEKIKPGNQWKLNAPGNIDYYKITVSDNGIGFDPKYAEEIFMVFKRLHSYHEFEGTGVGLSICKKIIEKHSGVITADSKSGKGSDFILVLPRKQPAEIL
jgi:light-regulated signal transduction histidine kinase (bacteriophytochrome)